jgi:hypothetical protein
MRDRCQLAAVIDNGATTVTHIDRNLGLHRAGLNLNGRFLRSTHERLELARENLPDFPFAIPPQRAGENPRVADRVKRFAGTRDRLLGSRFVKHQTKHELEFTNLSRIVSLPCKEDTIRGFARAHLLVIDEAARVPDDLYRAVRPMLAVSRGRLICLSTPYGQRGFFHQEWAHGGNDWVRIEVPAERISRISPQFLEQERRSLGESWFRQEYGCSFEVLEGLVYPDFAKQVAAVGPLPEGRLVGGIDFGFRNPFAAVWGVVDRDGVLWLTGEHYCRNKPLSYHAQHLPRCPLVCRSDGGQRDLRAAVCGVHDQQGRECLTAGHCGSQRPVGERVAARLHGGLPQPAGRGDVLSVQQ